LIVFDGVVAETERLLSALMTVSFVSGAVVGEWQVSAQVV
jgi:uncharacterized membrane protein YciS (DUF1049 family)